jgi:hypothetical protein
VGISSFSFSSRWLSRSLCLQSGKSADSGGQHQGSEHASAEYAKKEFAVHRPVLNKGKGNTAS